MQVGDTWRFYQELGGGLKLLDITRLQQEEYLLVLAKTNPSIYLKSVAVSAAFSLYFQLCQKGKRGCNLL